MEKLDLRRFSTNVMRRFDDFDVFVFETELDAADGRIFGIARGQVGELVAHDAREFEFVTAMNAASFPTTKMFDSLMIILESFGGTLVKNFFLRKGTAKKYLIWLFSCVLGGFLGLHHTLMNLSESTLWLYFFFAVVFIP